MCQRMIVSQSTLLSRHEGLLKQKQFVWIILYMHYDNYNVSQYSKIPFWEKQNCNFLLACSRNYFIFLDKLFYCVQKAGCHLSMHLSALLQLIQNRNKIFSHFIFLKFTQYENNFLCQAFYYDKGWSLFVISIEIKYWEKNDNFCRKNWQFNWWPIYIFYMHYYFAFVATLVFVFIPTKTIIPWSTWFSAL